ALWCSVRLVGLWTNMVQNYWTHDRRFGARRYHDDDNAMNIGDWLPVTATFSACLQNNHHHHPQFLRLSHAPEEYDFGFRVVRLMKSLRLVAATRTGTGTAAPGSYGWTPAETPEPPTDPQGIAADHLLALEMARRQPLPVGVARRGLERLPVARDAVRKRIVPHQRTRVLGFGHEPGQAHRQGRGELQPLVREPLGLDEGVVETPRQPRMLARELLSHDQGVHDREDPG